MPSLTEVVALNHDELLRSFAGQAPVGPRRGPNRRTQEQKEWYCVRTYLCTLADHGQLRYPIRVSKSEPPRPDFIVNEDAQETYGLEVTEATTDEWQRELTITENSDKPTLIGPGWVGDSPEIETVELIHDAIRAKSKKVPGYNVSACDLLIYENARPGLVLDAERLFARVVSANRAGSVDKGLLRIVSVIVGSDVYYDLFGEPRRLPVHSFAT